MDYHFKILNPDWSRFWTHTYEVADTTMVDPRDDTRVIQGEWVEIHTVPDQVTRATNPNVLHYPKVDRDGQYDVQAINSISVIKTGNFEVDTDVYDTATLATVGQPVEIDQILFTAPGAAAASNRGIPTLWSGVWPALLVGYVTRAPVSGRIRFQTVCF